MWPKSSPIECFSQRRARFLERFDGVAAFGSGLSRVRNFAANRYPFRADSHFLYFVGQHLEQALLVFDGGATLYAEEPNPADELWYGPELSLAQLEKRLGLPVKPLSDFQASEGVATLAPEDAESAFWLEEQLLREVEPGSSGSLSDIDEDLAETMIDLRLRSDEHAVRQMEQACEVTGLAHVAGMQATRAGQREMSVRSVMEHTISAHGMALAYNPIVTVRGEVLHHESSTQVMTSGDLLLADVGSETPEGWASDVTRTWPVSGRFSGLQREIYQAVLEAQLAAIELVRPGADFRAVHRRAARVLTQGLIDIGLLKGDAESLLADGAASVFFPHGIGHLLGLDVHDMEDLGDRAGYAPGRSRAETPAERYLRLDRELEPGMVVTIEPGFYVIDALLRDDARVGPIRSAIDANKIHELAGFGGIRIEDDVLVTADGARVLSAAIPKTVAEVEAASGH